MRAAMIAAACSAIVGACASLPQATPPTEEEVSKIETWRVLAPYASPLARDGSLVVEFGPSVETRGVGCVPDGEAYACAYESREKPFGAGTWTSWSARTMRVVRNARTRCWVAE
jgi:hypothetical protein